MHRFTTPSAQRLIAVLVVIALTAVNYRGIQKTALATRVMIVLVLLTLALVVAAGFLGGTASLDHFAGSDSATIGGVLQAAGLLFFVFAGYARIATLVTSLGLAGCGVLAVTLPITSVLAGTCVLAVGAGIWAIRGSDDARRRDSD